MASILADIDTQIEYADYAFVKLSIEKWIESNYFGVEVEISDKPNEDGKFEVNALKSIYLFRNIEYLTNGLFIWKHVNGDFMCKYDKHLISLEGAPISVDGDFSCAYCTKLKDLTGAPEIVNGSFECYYCKSLTSLKGAPKEVGKDFCCYDCTSLESLEGISPCISRDLICIECKTKFEISYIKSLMTNIKGKVYNEFYSPMMNIGYGYTL